MRFHPVFNREPGLCRYFGHPYQPNARSFRDDDPGSTYGRCGGTNGGYFAEPVGRWERATMPA